MAAVMNSAYKQLHECYHSNSGFGRHEKEDLGKGKHHSSAGIARSTLGGENDFTEDVVESDAADDEEVSAPVVTTDLPTDEYFHTKVERCLKCTRCSYSRSREELYRNLSIDVSAGVGVERSLEHFFQAEDIDVKCEKCKEGTSATRTIKIISR